MNLNGTKWLFLDVDGVMTDGRLYYDASGEQIKVFNVKDGLGIKNVRDAGVKVGIISGRGCEALLRRLEELECDEIYVNRPDKGKVFQELKEKYGDEVLDSVCLGDDLPDLELYEACRYGIAVNDAVDELIDCADLVLKRKGGEGAVRELCDLLVKRN